MNMQYAVRLVCSTLLLKSAQRGVMLGLALSACLAVASSRAAPVEQSARVMLLNPAAIGPGTKAGELDAVLSKLSCASSSVTLTSCSPEIQQTTLQGITADGAAAALITLLTNAQVPLTFTITNEATLVLYDPNYRSYPPMAGSTSITLQPAQFQNCNGQPCVELVVQAPDILKPGPDGGLPSYTQPVTLTVTGPGVTPAQAQVTLYPPPILFLHGLCGTSSSLSKVQTSITSTTPWSGLPPAFFLQSGYDGNIAFDSGATTTSVLNNINAIVMALSSQEIAVGRVDVVAHSMGGLVLRHVSTASGYTGPQNRTLGAFHQIVTIDTPEAGSLLANFLIANQSATFSPNAGTVAQQVVKQACGGTTTVGACFAHLKQPVADGATMSLEPGSPNIGALPSGNIPNAVWRALAATVSQADTMGMGRNTNALVWEIDELIAATCPGATFCPNPNSPIPEIGDILNDKINDGVVPLASQTSGCVSPCEYTQFDKLAHTVPAGPKVLMGMFLNFKNVLQSSAVDGQVECILSNTACANRPMQLASDTSKQGDDQDGDQSDVDLRAYHEVHRLPDRLPDGLALGTPFRLRVRFPFAKVDGVAVRQFDSQGGAEMQDDVPIEKSPDGQTYAVVTPLLPGKVKFIFNAVFKDHAYSVQVLSAQVGNATEQPKSFVADYYIYTSKGPNRIWGTMGLDGIITPSLIFASAPDYPLTLRKNVTFRVLPGEGAPVIDMHPDGTYTPLRVGRATVELGYAGLTTRTEVVIMP